MEPTKIDNMSEWLNILYKYLIIPQPKSKKTSMQICGYSCFENVCSNFLAFFFDPQNEHGLKDLCYKALLKAASKKINIDSIDDIYSLNVEREFPCDTCRLDLVLESDQYVIGIENKIKAPLVNDLACYAKSVEKRANELGAKAICIVLSIDKLKPRSIFINITYKEFFRKLKKLIGDYAPYCNNQYLFHLNEFIKTIEEFQMSDKLNTELIAFFKSNHEDVEKLVLGYDRYKGHLANNISALQERIKVDDKIIKQWVYQKNCLVHDFINEGIAIDSYITPKGWSIELLERDHNNKSLAKLVDHLIHNEENKIVRHPTNKSRFKIHDNHAVDMSISELAEFLDKLLANCLKYFKQDNSA